MKRAAMILALATLLAPSMALAQPSLPTLTGPTARRVGHLERVARRTLGCVAYDGGDRGGEEYSDDRCWDWYARLESSGNAGAHAAGRVLLAELARTADEPNLGDGAARLLSILATSRRPVAAPYLLHALAASRTDSPRDRALSVAALAGLEQLTGNDVAPLPPWESPYDAVRDAALRAGALARWSAWYETHRGERRAEWRAAGIEAARARLDERDARIRFAAIRRLAEERRAHFALQDSLRALLTRPDLDGAARRYVARYATRRGLLRLREVRELLREVQT